MKNHFSSGGMDKYYGKLCALASGKPCKRAKVGGPKIASEALGGKESGLMHEKTSSGTEVKGKETYCLVLHKFGKKTHFKGHLSMKSDYVSLYHAPTA